MTDLNKVFAPREWRGLLFTAAFPGRVRLINFAAAATSWVRGKERSVALWKNAPFHVNLTDRIQRQMWLGCYEVHVSRLIAALLEPGATFLDIGANIGYHSYFAAGLVGAEGAVYAFEPDPELYALLARNLSAFPSATAVNAAVWESDAMLEFEKSFLPEESGWGTLTAVRNLKKGECISVSAISLDAWNDRAIPDRVNFVKLDAEGSEVHVLRGARAMLKKFQPVLLLEVNAPLLLQGKSTPAELLEDLSRQGYAAFVCQGSRVRPYSPIDEHETIDCICIPREQSEGMLERLTRYGFTI